MLAKTFRELEIWKLAIEIAKQTYAMTAQLPDEERYGLRAQMRRASISLSANIAEGFRRQSAKEFKQFLRVALGSATELESYCELCHVVFNGRSPKMDELLSQLDCFERMTNSMRTRLQSNPSKRRRTDSVTQSPSHPNTQ